MSIGDALASALEYIQGFWPVRVVPRWNQGVLVRAGRVANLLTSKNGWRGTGIHFFCPFWSEIHTMDCSLEVAETPMQTCTTANGETVSFSLIARYSVVDMRDLYESIYEGGATVLTLIQAAAGEIVANYDEDVEAPLAQSLGDLVYKDVATRLNSWGIEIDDINLGNFVVCRAYRVIGDTPRPFEPSE